MLRAFPFRIVTHNVGDVGSIGISVFLAGNQRYASANSRFFIHGIVSSFDSPSPDFTADQLREALDHITSDELRISSIIEQHSKLTEAEIVAFFREGRRMGATEALTAGIIQEIKEVKIPPDSPVVVLDFESERHDDENADDDDT